MEELINEMNPWWERNVEFIGIKREKYLSIFDKNLLNKDILLITGLRRVGKSTLLKQYIYRLITEHKINPKKICYLSLDAYIFNDSSIQDLIRLFRKINNLKIDEKVYLFFDEVASKKDFKQELKNLYDLGNSKIFASSSSATLLIDKKAYLTGRSRTIEINPLDFDEFLLFRKYNHRKSEKYLLENYFKKYLEYGGMPEYVLTKDPSYITNLVDNIIYKDIIAMNKLRNPEIVKDLFRLLCERVGKQVSFSKLGRIIGISKDSVKKYVYYFVDCYLFFMIEKDERSLNARISDNKKIYLADVGIRNVTVGFKDLGAVFENLVFLKIRNKNPRYIKKNGVELDFRFENNLIEAKYGSKLNDKQKKLFDKLKIKNKIIADGMDFFVK